MWFSMVCVMSVVCLRVRRFFCVFLKFFSVVCYCWVDSRVWVSSSLV